jgi:hypothetical protein
MYGCGDGANTPNADGCSALTYEEALNGQEPDLSSLDEHPSRIDVEVDPATHLIAKFTITIIEENEDADLTESNVETHTVVFTYSKYNEITIEAPE